MHLLLLHLACVSRLLTPALILKRCLNNRLMIKSLELFLHGREIVNHFKEDSYLVRESRARRAL